MLVRLVVGIILLAVFAGCGRMGPPKAPEEFAPSEVQYFSVSGKSEGVRLSWRAPGGDTDSGGSDEVTGYNIYRWELEKESSAPREKIAEVKHQKAKAEYVYIDKEVNSRQAYQYAVVAYNAESAGSYKFIARLVFRGEVTEVTLLENSGT